MGDEEDSADDEKENQSPTEAAAEEAFFETLEAVLDAF